MSVTLEVFQFDMFASKVFMLNKSQLMSVMPETSQPAIRPYVASAEAVISLNSSTAVFRATLRVNL